MTDSSGARTRRRTQARLGARTSTTSSRIPGPTDRQGPPSDRRRNRRDRPRTGTGLAERVGVPTLLRELECGRPRDPVPEIELQGLARIRVGLRRRPVELVVAVAEVLEAGVAARVLLDLILRDTRGARQGGGGDGDVREVR